MKRSEGLDPLVLIVVLGIGTIILLVLGLPIFFIFAPIKWVRVGGLLITSYLTWKRKSHGKSFYSIK